MYKITATVNIDAYDATAARESFDQMVREAVNARLVERGAIVLVSVEETRPPVTLTLTEAEERIVNETLSRFRAS